MIMGSEEIICDDEIENMAIMSGYSGRDIAECRLSLVELISKAAAGYRNSYTEENFMNSFKLLKADRTLNKRGRKFTMSMIYKHSNKKAEIYDLIHDYRS